MKTSLKKFTIRFVAGAFGFLLLTNALGQRPEILFDGSVTGIILAPFKLILMGPLVPFINFLHQDPDTPPPFFLAGFAFYWTLLGLGLYYILTKLKKRHESAL
ncbi:hypothetical protein [Mucilaginibacter pocheonensis]|uniref:Uncharacterized protein n=1 Tax=Mucilaginibacter pocheonensis TaxID=398050 RepID=A0ABU1TI42_9SPHI|nr:hypothetical protein [Mucilaginibacter pocheonensis]MDR6945085.1 hypothetical protein [Mucilaginibacter pocheonensis]